MHAVSVTPYKFDKPKKKNKKREFPKALVLSENNPNKDYTCGKCGHKGHVEKDCWNDKLVCYNCGKVGHVSYHCPQAREKMNAAQELKKRKKQPLRYT